MIWHLSYVACDTCHDPASAADDAREARGIARREGFTREDGKDICPRCREKRKDPEGNGE